MLPTNEHLSALIRQYPENTNLIIMYARMKKIQAEKIQNRVFHDDILKFGLYQYMQQCSNLEQLEFLKTHGLIVTDVSDEIIATL